MLKTNHQYIELSDGTKWYPELENGKPTPEILAHSLGNMCRFTGHSKFFYSVAEHCVKCSYLVPKEYAFEALLHDAHEVYTNDLAKPVKNFIGGTYKDLEDLAEEELRRQYGIPIRISPKVKHADNVMVLIEAMDLLPSRGEEWDYLSPYYAEAFDVYSTQQYYRPKGWGPTLSCMYPGKAESMWLDRYKELTND